MSNPNLPLSKVEAVDRLDDILCELQVLNCALQHPDVQGDIVEPVRISFHNTIGRLRSVRNDIEEGGAS